MKPPSFPDYIWLDTRILYSHTNIQGVFNKISGITASVTFMNAKNCFGTTTLRTGNDLILRSAPSSYKYGNQDVKYPG